MTRLALGALVGVAVGVIVGAALGIHASPDIPDDVTAAADEAGVDRVDLMGAVNTTHMAAHDYLYAVGELAPPPPPVAACGWPICGALGQRLFCIEALESHHGAAMWNPVAVWNGEHAAGWLGFLPSTARRWGAVIGNRWSEWMAAAAMIRAGAGGQFFGIQAGRC